MLPIQQGQQPQTKGKDDADDFLKQLDKNRKKKRIGGVLCCVVVVIIIVVVVLANQCNTDLNVIINPDDYVKLIFTECPSQGAEQAFINAATRLSAAVGQTNNFVDAGADVNFEDVCGAGVIGNNPLVSIDQALDGLVIAAEVVDIDGAGGVLAQAGPCGTLQATGLPPVGLMRFDNADLDNLEADGTLEDVILHEMLHVLGIGTLWGLNGVINDPVFTVQNGQTVGDPNANPNFDGQAGVSEFSDIGGNGNIPIENGVFNGQRFFDVANLEGQGSVDGHWKLETFTNELMVFQIDPNLDHPLSAMSLASLQDVGYQVDLSIADDFSLNSAKTAKSIQSLRHSDGKSVGPVHDLSHDELDLPLHVIGSNGKIIK